MPAPARQFRTLAAQCRRLAKQADNWVADALNDEAAHYEIRACQLDKPTRWPRNHRVVI